MKLRHKIKGIVATILIFCSFCLFSCKKNTTSELLPPSVDRSQIHQNSLSAVTKDAVYWEEGETILRLNPDGSKTKLAEGAILGAVGEYLYYTSQDGVYCYKDLPILLAPLGNPCLLAGATETEVILFNECEVFLLNQKDPTQSRKYHLNHNQFGGPAATIDGETLYWFGNNALCKTDLQKGTTETVKELGYIGTTPVSFYWMGEQLYFYYGYTVYRCNGAEVTPLTHYQENTVCVFDLGYAYTPKEVLDLESGVPVHTLEAESGFQKNQWGIAYRSENTVHVLKDEPLSIPLPEKFDPSSLCYATPNGALIKGEKNYILARQNEDGEWEFQNL